ncbi:DUF5666 domain-containing protein [Sphaerotilus mobilis]|uniref:DUF5666 domain-containing protein n=1 Tax=Sphaerotilus mobilis TaxID=47994 RepID=A0A4V2EVB7_9BURK|nr:DUF5666 domain-containing protein [Sphaerotilus mobilis]RZS51930.1 hypothetical protein EV685_3115 [Sphaerotilus mobilis]
MSPQISRDTVAPAKRVLQLTLAGVFAAVIAACGGGGVGAGGTGATASGTVNGFGSVVIGGVRYDDSGISVSGEDASDDSKLRLGMSVDVSFDDSSCTTAATPVCVAKAFEIHSDLAGEVTADTLDVNGNGTIEVLGQTIAVTNNTFIHRSSGVSSALGLGTGQIVKVHGRRAAAAAATDWVATYIEIKAATDAGLAGLSSSFQFRLAGALTGTAGNYQIGGEPVDLTGITVPSGTNPFVRVRITPAAVRPANGWDVAELKSQRSRSLERRDRSRVEVQGYVESADVDAVANTTTLVINGVDVKVSGRLGAVEFEGSGLDYAALAATSALLEVKGTIDVNGVLIATKIELEDENEREFYALATEIGRVDTVANTFVVTKRNTDPITVTYSDTTPGVLEVSEASLGTQKLEIKGNLDRATGNLIATRIKRED